MLVSPGMLKEHSHNWILTPHWGRVVSADNCRSVGTRWMVPHSSGGRCVRRLWNKFCGSFKHWCWIETELKTQNLNGCRSRLLVVYRWDGRLENSLRCLMQDVSSAEALCFFLHSFKPFLTKEEVLKQLLCNSTDADLLLSNHVFLA